MLNARYLRTAGAAPAIAQRFLIAVVIAASAACSTLLPRSEALTDSPWQTFEEAQRAFDQVILHKTTVADLKRQNLDPASNPNVTILNYSDVLRRFIPSPSVDASSLDAGVQECLRAATHCQGYEVDHRVLKRNRYGNFWADLFNFRRKTDIVGWRFNAVVLITDGVVVYKLTGGQPVIHEHEESNNPLGPLQGAGEAIFR
ncbi:MAG: hypothetical protein D4R58_01435 [Betaproteobacteria bacterium]|nr:MAG: hypothetical protein D4R58_01435 [Betaproteobacteria bacterium]